MPRIDKKIFGLNKSNLERIVGKKYIKGLSNFALVMVAFEEIARDFQKAEPDTFDEQMKIAHNVVGKIREDKYEELAEEYLDASNKSEIERDMNYLLEIAMNEEGDQEAKFATIRQKHGIRLGSEQPLEVSYKPGVDSSSEMPQMESDEEGESIHLHDVDSSSEMPQMESDEEGKSDSDSIHLSALPTSENKEESSLHLSDVPSSGLGDSESSEENPDRYLKIAILKAEYNLLLDSYKDDGSNANKKYIEGEMRNAIRKLKRWNSEKNWMYIKVLKNLTHIKTTDRENKIIERLGGEYEFPSKEKVISKKGKKDCKPYQHRNEKGRCVNIPCEEGEIRDRKTHLCRPKGKRGGKIKKKSEHYEEEIEKAVKEVKKCPKKYQHRNEKGKCVDKPCNGNKVRDKETHNCRPSKRKKKKVKGETKGETKKKGGKKCPKKYQYRNEKGKCVDKPCNGNKVRDKETHNCRPSKRKKVKEEIKKKGGKKCPKKYQHGNEKGKCVDKPCNGNKVRDKETHNCRPSKRKKKDKKSKDESEQQSYSYDSNEEYEDAPFYAPPVRATYTA